MVSSKQVPLSDAYWFQEGPGVRNWQFTTSGVKLLNVGNITKDGNIDLDKTDKHISLDEAEGKYSHFLVDEGDLVIASSGISFDEDGMLRTRGAFIEKKHLPLCLNTSTIRFKAIEGISDLNFFKFWLDSFEFRDQVSRLVTGSAQQNFGPSHLKIINISLPPLTEQKRIASLLARADRLCQLRRTAHDLGDALLQSVFLEMFGDVKLNQKGWDVIPLEEIVQPGRIITYGIVQAGPHIEDGIPYIRTGDIKEGQIIVDGLLRTSKEIAAKYKRSEVKAGELVMSIRATVGTIAELPPQLDGANLTQGTARISPGSKVNKKFLLYAIRSQGTQKLIEDRVKGATFREITLEALREVPMIVPPLSLQEEFAGVVARVESLRGRMGESARQVEGLFESLLAGSFGGTYE